MPSFNRHATRNTGLVPAGGVKIGIADPSLIFLPRFRSLNVMPTTDVKPVAYSRSGG